MIQNKKSGQIMMLSVLIIGTSILVFSTIAGYLMLQRLKAVSYNIDSTQAIFAADSGIECELYRYNKAATSTMDCNALGFNDLYVTVATTASTTSGGNLASIESIGSSIKSKRAFLYTAATSTATSTP